MKNGFIALAALMAAGTALAAPAPGTVDAGTAPATMDGAAPQAGALTADLKIAQDVQNLEPVGVADTFTPDTATLVAWSRITGADQPTEVTHVWKRNGEVVSRVPLKVGSASFRTYSRKTVTGLRGNWTVEVHDAAGNVIATKHFNVMLPQP